MLRKLRVTCVLVALQGTAATLAGDITPYFDRVSFNAALAESVTIEDFTSSSHFPISTGILNSETNLPRINLFPGDIEAGVTYSVSPSPAPGDLFFNIDNAGDLDGPFLDGLRGDDPHTPLTITFDGVVKGFGFDTNSLMGPEFNLVIDFQVGPDYFATVPNPGEREIRFFGFISSAQNILSAQITGSANDFDFALDNFTFTEPTPIPEPSTLTLAGLGLVGVVCWRRCTLAATSR